MEPADFDLEDRIIDAALARAQTDGWLAVSMAEIAADADVSVAEAFAAFPSKSAILEALLERVDRRMLADAQPDFAETARDRLFEVIMLRMDALAPHRRGIAAVLRDLPGDPETVFRLLPGLHGRLARILEAAGLSSSGPLGLMRVNGLALILLDTARVWVTDDSADMARTMATLDRGLRRAESLMRITSGLRPPRLGRSPTAMPPQDAPHDDDDGAPPPTTEG